MFTKILTIDDATGSASIQELFLPVPQYELGTLVGFLTPGKSEPVEGIVTGYDIHVSQTKDSSFTTQILYSIDNSTWEVTEEEITHSYDEKEWDVVPLGEEGV